MNYEIYQEKIRYIDGEYYKMVGVRIIFKKLS